MTRSGQTDSTFSGAAALFVAIRKNLVHQDIVSFIGIQTMDTSFCGYTTQFTRVLVPRKRVANARTDPSNGTVIKSSHGEHKRMRDFPSLNMIRQDVRFGLRQLMKSPVVSAIAVLTLACGIGANTAVFTLTWTIILKGLPVPHPDRLVEYVMDNGKPTTIGLSGAEYSALEREQRSCEGLLAWMSDRVDLRLGDSNEKTAIQMLSRNAFEILQMHPHIGNFFGENSRFRSDGMPAVLSYDLWKRTFNGDPGVVGRTVYVANQPVTVTGVMPMPFEGLTANFHPSIYLPLDFADSLYGKGFTKSPQHFALYVLGRLKRGRTLADANLEVMGLESRIRHDADPSGIYLNQFFKEFRLRARDGRSGISWVKEVYSRPLLVLEMLVMCLLLLTCMNTALAMLARVSGRRQEYAVRIALGAGRNRLIAQTLIETVLLTIPALALGMLIGWGSAHSLIAMLGVMGGASSMDVRPNVVILGFNLCTGVVIALAAGLWPALRAAGASPAVDLKARDRAVAAHRLGGSVVMLQVAVSASLLAAAMLLGGTLARYLSDATGFDAAGVAVASIDLQRADSATTETVVANLLRNIQLKPGILAAGFSDTEPLSNFFGSGRLFAIDSRGTLHGDSAVLSRWVTPGYFDAIGTHLVRGAGAASLARGAMPKCVLSKDFAAAILPEDDAVGRVVYGSTEGEAESAKLDRKAGCLIVGIAENARLASLRTAAPHVIYNLISPLQPTGKNRALFARLGIHLIVRAKSDSLALAALQQGVKETVRSPEQVHFETFRQLENRDLNRERMLMRVSSSLGVLALPITALGMYGLLMRSVVLRRREIGIRMALGAQRAKLVFAIAQRTLRNTVIGLLVGEFAAVLLVKAIRKMLALSQTQTGSPYLWSSVILLTVVVIAFLFPIRQMTTVDPANALRAE